MHTHRVEAAVAAFTAGMVTDDPDRAVSAVVFGEHRGFVGQARSAGRVSLIKFDPPYL